MNSIPGSKVGITPLQLYAIVIVFARDDVSAYLTTTAYASRSLLEDLLWGAFTPIIQSKGFERFTVKPTPLKLYMKRQSEGNKHNQMLTMEASNAYAIAVEKEASPTAAPLPHPPPPPHPKALVVNR